MFEFDKSFLKRFDWILFTTVIILVAIGIHLVYIATFKDYDTSFLKSQLAAGFIGGIAAIIFMFFDYDYLEKFYKPLYFIMIGSLFAVLLFGDVHNNAKSWISIGKIISFQPSEVCKLIYIITMSKIMSDNKENISKPLVFGEILIWGLIPILLILAEPDFGTSLVYIIIFAIMIFAAGLDIKYFFTGICAAIITLPLFWHFLKPYQRNRLLDFFDPSRDPSGSGYQANQSKIAIGSGKMFGRGLDNAKLIQYGYLPYKHNDFIFSVVGEVYGFIGTLVILLLFLILLFRLLRLAQTAISTFHQLILVGIMAMFLYHIIQNVGMTVGLMPVTGIPLPFISQGGTSLMNNLISIGLAIGLGMRRKKYMFET